MATEVAIGGNGYAGPLLRTATGDFLVLTDTAADPAASRQRLIRIVMTNPLLRDALGNPIGRPDDLCNPAFGSGVRQALGQPLTAALEATIKNATLAAIARDPNFAPSPAPSVVPYIASNGSGLLLLSIAVTNILGHAVTIPDLAIQQF